MRRHVIEMRPGVCFVEKKLFRIFEESSIVRFVPLTIALLVVQLGHAQAIGFSMEAQQAFQCAVSYPTFMDAIGAASGIAKTDGHGIVRLEGEIVALTSEFLAGIGKSYR